MHSLWTSTVPQTEYAPLPPEGVNVDVAVVGGGLAGICTAFLLKRAGRTVAVVESRRIGHGETGHTTAHVTAIQDIGFRQIASKFGKEGARRMAEQGMEAIGWIEHVAREEGIDCDFARMPAYVFTEKLTHVPRLLREQRVAKEIGLRCEWVKDVPLPFRTEGGMRVEDQGRFHALKFLLGLAQRIHGDGSFIFENTHMTSVEEGHPCRVKTQRGEVRAGRVVMATDAVTVNRFLMQTKLAPYRTYAIGVRIPAPIEGLFYDTASPYHYIRSHPAEGGPVLIVGGADHRVGEVEDTQTRYEKLEGYTRARFPDLGPVDYRWSGQVEEPMDGLPYIGQNALSSRVYVATGFSGTGMVNAVLAAHVLSELVQGRRHPLEKLLDPTRLKPLASLTSFVAENVDYPRHLVTDRLPARRRSVEELAPGQGQIVSHRGRKLAVYRSDDGELHALSPVCPHMGCHVHWNAEATSWDCPCHGSRFDCTGRVLHGPAVRNLQAVDLEREEEAPRVPPPEEPGAYP